MKKQIITVIILLILSTWVISCTKSVSEISEEDVRKISNEIQTSAINKDIEGTMKFFAPNIIINVTADTPFGPQRMRLSPEEYEAETKRGWAVASEYEYRRENEKIMISEDRRSATAEMDVVESMVIEGRKFRSKTHETVTLEIVDGKILVTVLEAVVALQ
jgi:hypothetical protein